MSRSCCSHSRLETFARVPRAVGTGRRWKVLRGAEWGVCDFSKCWWDRVDGEPREVRATRPVVSPFTIVFAMACIGSSRLCVRVERLCQFGHFAQLRRKVSTMTCVKSRPVISRTGDALLQHCQVRYHEAGFCTRSNCPAPLTLIRSASPRWPMIRRARRAWENTRFHSIFRDFPRFPAVPPT